MKAILMSIRPQHAANILNGLKTIEIRKKFPSDYVGWVYIYVTKGKPLFVCKDSKGIVVKLHDSKKNVLEQLCVNGKVVARFWCDKVEEHRPFFHWCIEKETCLTRDDVLDYLDSKDKSVENPKRQGKVSAIHITKLEIFDKPKEIKEFKTHLGCNKTINCMFCKYYVFKECTRPRYLTRVPQSYCFIEV